jgi:hypothetical protein
VPVSVRLLHTLVEIWFRRNEPETADVRRVLHAAEVLEDDPSSPTHLRAFAWHLAVETHRAVGWDLPADVRIASCRAAADSLSHATSLLIDEITEHVGGTSSPVLVLGAFAGSRAVFGRWDLLPARGALLVSLDRGQEGRSEGPELSEIRGIRWTAPGKLRRLYERHASPTTLDGDQVLVPSTELVAARSNSRALRPDDPAALLFCGAAFTAASAGRWQEVMHIAKSLGHASAPLEAALQLGLEGLLGIEVGRLKRAMITAARLLRR